MNAVSAPARVDHGTKRILIVDDDRTVCEILVEFFKAFKHGHAYDLATARDGNEAMGALRREKFDLVMLDLGMPRMSGLDVLTHMRHDAIRVPVLMLTGNKNTHAAAEALRSGVFAYIPKPVDLLPDRGDAVLEVARRMMKLSPVGTAGDDQHAAALAGSTR